MKGEACIEIDIYLLETGEQTAGIIPEKSIRQNVAIEWLEQRGLLENGCPSRAHWGKVLVSHGPDMIFIKGADIGHLKGNS